MIFHFRSRGVADLKEILKISKAKPNGLLSRLRPSIRRVNALDVAKRGMWLPNALTSPPYRGEHGQKSYKAHLKQQWEESLIYWEVMPTPKLESFF